MPHNQSGQRRGGEPWTPAEDEVLSHLHGVAAYRAFADLVGRSVSAVRTRRSELRGLLWRATQRQGGEWPRFCSRCGQRRP